MHILNEFIKKNTKLINMMKSCSYQYDKNDLNLHHLEGDVWTHTMMSYQNSEKYNCSIYVKWAIILHDIGRILTRSENTKKGLVSFGNFEGASVYSSIDVLNKTNLTDEEKIKILKIISFQYTVIDHIKYNKPTRNKLLRKFRYEEDILQELAQYVRCDLLGRDIDKRRIHLYNKERMQDFINFTKTLNKTTQDIKRKRNSVYILVGPPCSKKSTWVNKNNSGKIVLNRDLCVEEIGKRYGKDNYDDAYYYTKANKNIKEKVDILYKKREEYAKNSNDVDIIIDNPNLTLKNRKEWIKAFKNTYTIKVVIFLSSFDDLIICDKQRGEKINKKIGKQGLVNKLKTFQYPLLNEGIDYIVYGNK